MTAIKSQNRLFSIVIPTWNNLAFLKLCIQSIQRNSYYNHQIIVHVNDGSDGTLEWIKKAGIRLSDLVEDEKQKLLYVFDPLAERVFFIELSEIITGKDLDKAVCSRKAGEAPKQTVDFDEMMAKSNSGNLDIDENFYGDQDFDMEDFDPEGFDMGGASSPDPYEQENY